MIQSLYLENYRNYQNAELNLNSGVNIFCGDNAQGKTNILEAISLLSSMRLFRSGQKRDAVRFGCENAQVSADFITEYRNMNIKILLHQRGRPNIFVNDVKQNRMTDAVGLIKTVLFCPDDLYIIREGAAARRRFIDTALCQLRPNYAKYLAEYKRLHENKSCILRDYEENPSLLDSLDVFSYRMANIGGAIIRYRAYYLRSLMEKAKEIHSSISGRDERLSYNYITVSNITNPFESAQTIGNLLWEHMQMHRKAEIASHTCLSGPHKDDLQLMIQDKPVKDFGSQGQVRTCALSLKLAEREMFFDDCGEYPVLLLDDVLSELDARRQDFVLNRIENGQVLITCCEPEKLSKVKNGRMFEVINGTAKQI